MRATYLSLGCRGGSIAPSSDVEAVLFDLDDTLCSFVQSSEALLAETFEAVGVEPFFTLSEYQARYSDYLDPDGTVEELRANCFAELAAERGRDPSVGRDLAATYSSRRDYTVESLSGAAAAVEALAETHALGLVSNGRPSLQRPKLESLGFVDRFDAVVFGGHDVPPKPAPEPFHRALDELAAEPDNAVHVGNSLTTDVAGARAAGVRSVWVAGDADADPDVTPDFAVETVGDLVSPPW